MRREYIRFIMIVHLVFSEFVYTKTTYRHGKHKVNSTLSVVSFVPSSCEYHFILGVAHG